MPIPATCLPDSPVDERDLVIERIIDAPREAIFRLWSDPTSYDSWFCPEPVRVPLVEMDFRAGGKFRTVMRLPDGTEMDNTGIFLDIQAPSLIVFTDAVDGEYRPNAKPFMTGIITLTEVAPGKTRYHARILHATAEAKQQHEAMGFHGGWGAVLERIAKLVAPAS